MNPSPRWCDAWSFSQTVMILLLMTVGFVSTWKVLCGNKTGVPDRGRTRATHRHSSSHRQLRVKTHNLPSIRTPAALIDSTGHGGDVARFDTGGVMSECGCVSSVAEHLLLNASRPRVIKECAYWRPPVPLTPISARHRTGNRSPAPIPPGKRSTWFGKLPNACLTPPKGVPWGGSAADSLLLMAQYAHPYVVLVDRGGYVLRQRELPFVTLTVKMVSSFEAAAFERLDRVYQKPQLHRFVLWDLVSDKIRTWSWLPPFGGALHHDFEYNARRRSFLSIMRYESSRTITTGPFAGKRPVYDRLIEVHENGTLLWEWDVSTHFRPSPTWQEMRERECEEHFNVNCVDIFHGNTVHWDLESPGAEEGGGLIYYNMRNSDTFLCIDKGSGEIVWSVGRYGTIKSVEKDGSVVPSLFYHAHELKHIGPKRFLLYDNHCNISTTAQEEPIPPSRFLEFEVDTTAKVARVVWSARFSEEYGSAMMGGVQRLPSGNTLGVHSVSGHLVEVDPGGQIIWELHTTERFPYRAHTLYSRPGLWLPVDQGVQLSTLASMRVVTHDIWESRLPTFGLARLIRCGDEVWRREFQFPSLFHLEVPVNFTSCPRGYSLSVENSEGISNEKAIRIVGGNLQLV